MKKNRFFGTDGVRGIANLDMTPELAFKLGKASAYILSKKIDRPLFIVGQDTRISGDMLSSALTSGILSCNSDVINVGVIPTPAIAFLVRKYKASAGVMISASHNPCNYNGIKFFNKDGYKLPDSIEDDIQLIIENNFHDVPLYIGNSIGTCKTGYDALEHYINFITSATKENFQGLKIGLDCGNGATYMAANEIFECLGAHVYIINNKPDGLNINRNCGSTATDSLRELVLYKNLDMGFAFDGDGDRCIAVDSKGNVVSGDKILAICGTFLKNINKLKNNTVVSTVMSNIGLHKCLEQNKISTVNTKVGDRYVLEEMIRSGFNLGGENSGHIIFLDYNTTGDGILTAVQIASIVKNTEKTLEELASVMTEYPQILTNVTVKDDLKSIIYNNEELKNLIKCQEEMFKDQGRIVVRMSGTEPVIRVMAEGSDIVKTENAVKEISDKIKEISNLS